MILIFIKQELLLIIITLIITITIPPHLNIIMSESMEPELSRGDIVLVEKVNYLGIEEFNPNNVKKGDIIIYDANWVEFDKPVIHRVISVDTDENGEPYYILKGDNNNITDPENVYPKQVKAKVITVENKSITIPQLGIIILKLRGL